MKRLICVALALVVAFTCLGLAACGGGDGGTTPSDGDTTPPSGVGGFTWNDMPVYPGAKQIQEMAWTIPSEEGEWTKAEWRYYETGDSVSTVTTFYKSQMPGKGWQDTFWMEMEEMQWGCYIKNNEQDVAWVWIGSEEGKTVISLMRATE